MKILHVSCEGLGRGGVQAVMMSIIRNIQEVQFDIIVFTKEKRAYEDEIESLGGRIFRIPHYEGPSLFLRKVDYYIRFFRIFIGVIRILKKNKGVYSAVHCHNGYESGICNLAAYLSGINIRISHAHRTDYRCPVSKVFRNIYNHFLKVLMSWTSNVKIGCSEEAYKNLFGSQKRAMKSKIVLPNPIDLKKCNIKKNRNRDNKFRIAHIGQYCENKNQKKIIEILPYLIKRYKTIELRLIGFGDKYQSWLKDLAKKLEVEQYVHFLPAETDIWVELGSANVFVFPSKREGFGIAAIEAQAMEVPCILSDSIPRDVDCGLCKFVSLKKSNREWANEIIKITNNNSLELNIEKLNSYSLERYIERMRQIYLFDKSL